MRSSFAYVFPGQGSQYTGMGRELAKAFPSAYEIFDEADAALGFSLSSLCFSGAAEELQLTENTQPAILAVSVAALRAFQAMGAPAPTHVAGHSLGEYSALVAAGGIGFTEAVRVVRARGRFMQESAPPGSGAMAAILGADLQTVMQACREAEENEVCSPANINSPGQIVISGHSGAVDRALMLLKRAGARRVIRLKVSAPFHCSLMLPAQERLAAELDRIEFNDLVMPLVTNVDASFITGGDDARDALVRQVSSPVRWQESVERLVDAGIESFVEIGPGKVLSGLVRSIKPGVRCLNVENGPSLEEALMALDS